MVTLRGKKANAKPKSSNSAVASDKAAASHAAATTAAAAAAATGKTKGSGNNNTAGAPATVLSSQQVKAQELRRQREEEAQQKLLREKEERVLQLLKFAMQSELDLQCAPSTWSVADVGNTLVTALCGTGKDKKASPQQILEKLTRNVRKRVCGAIFTSDEIAYSCRNCQVDSTCVICQDCFAHSDHTGHDVYFQRTTAGSSCDCGDPHAWKPSSFCSKHPGIDDADASASKKHKLPKNIGLAAPVVIDAAVEHLFQVLLQAQHGFELAEAMEVFSRDIPPHVLSELADADAQPSTRSGSTHSQPPRTASSSSTSTSVASRASNALAARRSRSTRASRAADALESKREAAAAPAAFTQFHVRLHNDDVHTLTEVVDHIASIVGVSKATARDMVNQADMVGDTTIATRNLLQCGAVVGQLLRSSLNVTATPTWWQARMDALGKLLEWLYSLSCASDGLNELVMEALCKPRAAVVQGFGALSSALAVGASSKRSGGGVDDFVREHNARLNGSAVALFEDLVGSQSVAEWARDVEAKQRKLFTFRARADDDASSVVHNASGELVHCENVFIEDFLKAVALSKTYSRHQSVRDGVDAVVARFFTPDELPARSALTLLILHDCILRKDTVKKSHLLLREHMLAVAFRTAMLEAYVRSYRTMTTNFLRGLGNSSDTVFDFAVQFLTVPHLVKNYTRAMTKAHPERPHLLGELFASLELVFKSAVNPNNGVLNVDHPALGNQKYKHCVDNMEYVLNIGAIPNELVCDLENLSVWLACLTILQNGDLQVRRGIHQPHVEYESDSWLSMFNLGIRVHSVFPVAWNGFQPEELRARQLKLVDIFQRIVSALITRSVELNASVAKKTLAPVTVLVQATPNNNTNADSGDSSIIAYSFNVGADATSLHIPLHRFLAASIRHICIHQSGFADSITADSLLRTFGLDELSMEARLELVEMPLRCLVMASQIHSNLWRRNGDENMLAQLYNYSALPYCLHYRDADVFLLQLGVLLLGADSIVALMLNQFQLGAYFVRPADDATTPSTSAMPAGVLDAAHARGYLRLEEGIDAPQMLLLLEEFLRLVIIVGTSLPSATGVAYENVFLAEEMLQQLCAKSYSFSRLFDLAILPSGQDDLAIPRLEVILETVADFVPPSGLESGRYELKDGYLDRYNPYFLHLNRESHELARDKWTSFRKTRLQQKRLAARAADSGTDAAEPIEPLRAAPPAVPFLRPVTNILLCDATIAVVQLILWKVLRADGVSAASTVSNSVSDAVISTCLHLLVHGVHTAVASADNSGFFTRLCAVNANLDNSSVLHLLSQLHRKRATILDDEQAGTTEWLVWKLQHASPVCREFFAALDSEAKRSSAAATKSQQPSSGAAAAAPMTLEQRKDEARKRALEAMAKQQAAFQAMMGGMDDGDDDDEDLDGDDDRDGDASADRARLDSASDDDVSSPATTNTALVQLGKRRASAQDVDDELKKRQKLVDDASHKCILCHDTSTQGEMGIAAYVHQSTVLATAFRPEADEALRPAGKRVRNHVKKLIERMELCSGGPNASSMSDMSPSPRMRGYSGSFPDWYMDDSLALDAPMPPLSPGQRRQRLDGLRLPPPTHLPMLEGEMLQTDEELDVLEGVLNLREDQQLFPMDMRRAMTMELRGARAAAQQTRGATTGATATGAAATAGARERAAPPAIEPRRTPAPTHHNHNHHHHHHHHGFSDDSDDDGGGEEFAPGFHAEFAPPGISSANRESAKLYLTPCGLHIRTCQHAVHIHCLERYISSLHEKAIRGEEFDGVQAIDPDSAMTQFLCPLCKTLCNFLIPTANPSATADTDDTDDMDDMDDSVDDSVDDATGSASTSRSTVLAVRQPQRPIAVAWHSIVEEQMKVSGWYKNVLGQFGDLRSDGDSAHDLWRDYFEETLWEPHGSLEKGAPFLWSACAFSVAAFLSVAEDEHCTAVGRRDAQFDPLCDACPPSMEKELASLAAVTKFCRWSFSLLEHSADAKVIWETSKRCCPINSETKREYRKFTKLLGSIDACLRGTILGLLVADTFTAFVVSSVIAADPRTIWRFMPVFSVADVLQRLYAEFFVVDRTEDTSLFQDKYSVQDNTLKGLDHEANDDEHVAVSRTRSGKAISSSGTSSNSSGTTTADGPRTKATTTSDTPAAVLQELMDALTASGEQHSESFAALVLLKRMLTGGGGGGASEQLKPLTRSDLAARVARVQTANATFVRRMKLFWRCVSDREPFARRFGALAIPDIAAIAQTSDAVLDQVWKWCVDRLNSKSYLGVAKTGDKCEHTDGASEAYVASMFILHDAPSKPRLINLPVQYDELYSAMSGVKCDRCSKVPCDPGICLICGEYLCCGDACCTRPFITHGPQVGECTRHAAECGGGIGIVLLLDQCRVALIGGSMAAYFPSPYVDAHGEEDIGLQRGRPLRLDTARYRYLESLWVNHRIFTEVSRQRNQREPQYTVNLSYL